MLTEANLPIVPTMPPVRIAPEVLPEEQLLETYAIALMSAAERYPTMPPAEWGVPLPESSTSVELAVTNASQVIVALESAR